MTKAELIASVTKAVRRDLSKRAVEDVINALFKDLKKGLKKDKRFTFPGFGTFSVRRRAALPVGRRSSLEVADIRLHRAHNQWTLPRLFVKDSLQRVDFDRISQLRACAMRFYQSNILGANNCISQRAAYHRLL